MISKNMWDNEKGNMWLEQARDEVLKAFSAGEKKLKPTWTEMFTDVYKYVPSHLK